MRISDWSSDVCSSDLVFRLVIDAKDEVLADNDMVRIAAVGWKARLGLHAHIGARQPVLAVLLKPFAARRAMPAAVHHATDPDQIARLETGNALTDRTDPADDLMPGHEGITRDHPFHPPELNIRLEIGRAHVRTTDTHAKHVCRP